MILAIVRCKLVQHRKNTGAALTLSKMVYSAYGMCVYTGDVKEDIWSVIDDVICDIITHSGFKFFIRNLL